MTLPKYSLVIPVYNCESYLAECVDSILEQSYRNFELLLVDDGSTDLSGQLCDNLSLQDSRVRVIHGPNRGPSHARNRGITESKGEYLWFIDSDDKLSDNGALARLDYVITQCPKTDIVFFLYDAYLESFDRHLQSQRSASLEGEVHMSGAALMVDLFRNQDILTVATSPINKLFRIELLRDHVIRFPEDCRCHEEDEFLCKTVFWGKKFYFLNEIQYHVRTRNDSISTTLTNQKIVERFCCRAKVTLHSCQYFQAYSNDPVFLSTMFKHYSYYYLHGFTAFKDINNKELGVELADTVRKYKEIMQFFLKARSKYLFLAACIYHICGIKGLLQFLKMQGEAVL